MLKLFLTGFLIVTSLPILGQKIDSLQEKKVAQNSFYIDFGGIAPPGSIGYERITGQILQSLRLAFRIGVGPGIDRLGPLAEINLLGGEKKHFLETGGAIFYFNYTPPRGRLNRVGYFGYKLGYRFQSAKKGIMLRIFLMLHNEYQIVNVPNIMGGISIGGCF